MNQLAFYSVLYASPSRDRHELVTVGLVILREGKWDVRMLSDPSKILALNPLFPAAGIANIQKTILSILNGAENFQMARARLSRYGNDPSLHPFVGQFQAVENSQYEEKITGLMKRLILPVELPKSVEAKPRQRRLRTKLRNQFKKQGLFSTNPDDIEDHKIVGQYPIVADQGLFAEFALKNGAMHVTETIDFDVQSSSLRTKVLEAQAKTLVLASATEHFGPSTHRYVVISGSNRKHAQPSIKLLGDHADIFAVESTEEMGRYFDLIDAAVAHH